LLRKLSQLTRVDAHWPPSLQGQVDVLLKGGDAKPAIVGLVAERQPLVGTQLAHLWAAASMQALQFS
jgi:hypothetical protein